MTMQKTFRFSTTAFILMFAGSVWTSAGDSFGQSQRDPEFEKKVEEKLRAISAPAVAPFRQATASFDSAQYWEAKTGFETVLKLAPEFPDALRRLGSAVAALGDSVEAERLFRHALQIERSSANLAVLAHFLMFSQDETKRNEVWPLIVEARQRDPDDIFALTISIMYGFAHADENIWRPAISNLQRVAPDHMLAHYWRAVAAANDGNREVAENEILRARELGLPLEETTRMLKLLRAEPPIWHWARLLGYAAAGWAGGLILLLLLGFLLSKMTLATVEATQHHTTTAVGDRERSLRRIYRSVIAITSVYYYLSIPVVIVLVLIGGGAVLYGFLALGHIPIKLALLVAIGVLYTVYVMVRSLLIKPQVSEPGRLLAQNEAPLLWALVRDVAKRVGTRPVETIYLTPGTEVAVMERGSLMEKVRDAARRCLILGVGVMEGMTQQQLSAILAHEYGHFAHKDTAGGTLAWQVSHTMQQAAWGLALNNLAKWYNPAWLFISGFNRIFLRVTLGASRLQEVLADRYAAINFGAKAFAKGLTHVIKRSIEFNFTTKKELEKAFAEKRRPANLYALVAPSDGDEHKDLEAQFQQAMSHPMSEYDSHPPANQRIAWVFRLKTAEAKLESDGAAWDLLPQRATLEESETRALYEQVLANIQYQQKLNSRLTA